MEQIRPDVVRQLVGDRLKSVRHSNGRRPSRRGTGTHSHQQVHQHHPPPHRRSRTIRTSRHICHCLVFLCLRSRLPLADSIAVLVHVDSQRQRRWSENPACKSSVAIVTTSTISRCAHFAPKERCAIGLVMSWVPWPPEGSEHVRSSGLG